MTANAFIDQSEGMRGMEIRDFSLLLLHSLIRDARKILQWRSIIVEQNERNVRNTKKIYSTSFAEIDECSNNSYYGIFDCS